MASKDYLNYKLSSLRNEVPKVKKKLSQIGQALQALDNEIDTLTQKVENVSATADDFSNTILKNQDRVVAKMQKRIDELESMLAKVGGGPTSSTNDVVLSKARTIAIFDAILAAITGWSSHGDQASDIEAAAQSVVFPCVYERVMSGTDPAYILEEIPDSAELVVQRGREYVRWVRSQCETHITTPESWNEFAPSIQQWWIGDGLPLLYGERDPDWETDTLYTLEQIEVWRKNPADRIVAFPKIHDAIDILQKHRSEVYQSVPLGAFSQKMVQNRLE
jgi:hypothetical protein